MHTFILVCFVYLFFFYSDGWSKDLIIDEKELFSDTSSFVNPSEIVNTTPKPSKKKRKVTYFNGVVNGAFLGDVNRHWYGDRDSNNIHMSNFIVGNFMLDIRLRRSNKGFLNLELPYFPTYGSALVLLRELFIDGNIGKTVYWRMGKQVLQWGRCILWNPTDLINVEKKLFIPKIGYREGTYGLKMHVPFGTEYNLYGFLDTKSLTVFDSLALALKFEFLRNNTEMALSLWAKNHAHPVFAYDVSTRIIGFDITGELSFSEAANNYMLMASNDTLFIDKSGGVQTKACIDVGKKFNFLDFPQNLSVTLSFFFNSSGYKENIFRDTMIYLFMPPLIAQQNMRSQMPASLQAAALQTPKYTGTKKEFLLGNNLYEQHNYSRFYAAVFTQVDRLYLSGLTGTFNVVTNLPQISMIFSGGLFYTTIYEFFMGLVISAYVGGKNTEYTFDNKAIGLQANIGMTFY